MIRTKYQFRYSTAPSKTGAKEKGIIAAEHRTTVSSGVLSVGDGNYFELFALIESDTSVDVRSGAFTTFSIEVVETDENAFPPEDVSFFVSDALFDGALPTTGLIYKKRAARRFTLSDNFAGSVGHSEVTATGATTFDVQVDGVKIGEINVTNTANTATFTTTAATTEIVEAGESFEVKAPALGTL